MAHITIHFPFSFVNCILTYCHICFMPFLFHKYYVLTNADESLCASSLSSPQSFPLRENLF